MKVTHEPEDYVCPFCRNLNEGVGDHPLEIVAMYDEVAVKLNIKWWRNNRGAMLVVPRQHYENVWDLPVELGTPLQVAICDAAIALKAAFNCDGVSTRQHNEPAGYQDVWHYHVHVFPRYDGDKLYATTETYRPDAAEMRAVGDQLRAAWPQA